MRVARRARRGLAEVKPLALCSRGPISAFYPMAIASGNGGDADMPRREGVRAVMVQSRCAAILAANPPTGFGPACESGFVQRVPAWGASRLVTAGAGF